ncbi:energy transducer TonB family protein [Xanthomarina sp. F2636L]|uniref:energy transducer TonB family protein n=1 Tax=Xanthomarina sp. F2636L TaxID=2996018 RepID=UPI00225E49F6|nr:energy transducer TonB [Xanthomarina sp. F2636L]MCX7551020.1 TonB family protein [Xanthomarina sp. F2636L]
MNLSNKHKALLITFLVSGTIVLLLFSFHITKQNELIAESYYLLEPEEPKTPEELEAEKLAKAKEKQVSETNKAYNETQDYKKFAQAYQPIAPPKDYVPKPSESMSESKTFEPSSTPATSEIDDDVLSSYSSVNDVLNRRKPSNNSQSVNKKSSMHYSLVNRTHEYLPTPIYLCEEGGKIVVNITVNASGLVTDAYVNASSTSKNNCLEEHAMSYARDARFNAEASKPSQIGTITFYFEGKN